jgi:hypothetical protein
VDVVQFPNTVSAAAVERENVKLGVVVAVATLVLNNGERFPALNELTVAFEVLQVAHAICPAALNVIGAEAETATVPVAAGRVIVFDPATAAAINVIVPLVDPGWMMPAVGPVKAVAAEKFQVFPDAIKVPVFELVAAVIAENAVPAVALDVRVQSVRLAPELSTQDTVMFVPAMRFTVGRWVCAVPFASTVW